MIKLLKRVKVLLLIYGALTQPPAPPSLTVVATETTPIYTQVPGHLPLSTYWAGELAPGQRGVVIAISSQSCGRYVACGPTYVHLTTNGLLGAIPCNPLTPTLIIQRSDSGNAWYC